jgi:hypothetical protein
MTPAQLATLKAAILADPALSSQPMNSDGAYAIAQALNLSASPNWTVWKTEVAMVEVGKNINGSELGGLTTANHTRLQTIIQISGGTINPSLADQRAFFDDVFSGAGGALTRAKLLILWKRLATRGEKLYTTGTGSDASPATLVFEGNIDYQYVLLARNLP